jgi:hypothetical protein
MIELENLTGKQIKDLLTDLYINKNMTYWDMVKYLKDNFNMDITISGLHRWFLKLDIATREWSLPK